MAHAGEAWSKYGGSGKGRGYYTPQQEYGKGMGKQQRRKERMQMEAASGDGGKAAGKAKGSGGAKGQTKGKPAGKPNNPRQQPQVHYKCYNCETPHDYNIGWKNMECCRNPKCRAPIVTHLADREEQEKTIEEWRAAKMEKAKEVKKAKEKPLKDITKRTFQIFGEFERAESGMDIGIESEEEMEDAEAAAEAEKPAEAETPKPASKAAIKRSKKLKEQLKKFKEYAGTLEEGEKPAEDAKARIGEYEQEIEKEEKLENMQPTKITTLEEKRKQLEEIKVQTAKEISVLTLEEEEIGKKEKELLKRKKDITKEIEKIQNQGKWLLENAEQRFKLAAEGNPILKEYAASIPMPEPVKVVQSPVAMAEEVYQNGTPMEQQEFGCDLVAGVLKLNMRITSEEARARVEKAVEEIQAVFQAPPGPTVAIALSGKRTAADKDEQDRLDLEAAEQRGLMADQLVILDSDPKKLKGAGKGFGPAAAGGAVTTNIVESVCPYGTGATLSQ